MELLRFDFRPSYNGRELPQGDFKFKDSVIYNVLTFSNDKKK